MNFKNLVLQIIAILCLSIWVNAQSLAGKDFVGEYELGSHLYRTDGKSSYRLPYDSTLTLRANGTYTGGSECFPLNGEYTFADGVLILKAGVRAPARCFYSIVVRPEDAERFTITPAPEDVTLTPVRWSDRVYLIEESGWGDFVDSINAGLLPHTEMERNAYLGRFYRRPEDATKSVSGVPDVPQEWAKKILDRPVEAVIVEVKELNKGEFIASIEKGSRDGIREDIALFSLDRTDYMFGRGWVESVTETDAKIFFLGRVKVGEKVNTRLKQPRP